MRNSKLIKLLKAFPETDMKKFMKYLGSSLMKESGIYVKLLKILIKYYPGFESEELTREKIYSKLYPSKAYKETVIFTITSGLYKSALEFLAYNELQQNKKLKGLLINQKLHKLGRTDDFNKVFDSYYRELNDCPYDSSNMKILLEADQLAIQHYTLTGKYDNLKDVLERSSQNLILYFIEALSKLIHDINANCRDHNIEINNMAVIKFLEKTDLKNIGDENFSTKTKKLISIYISIIGFNYDEESYLKLKKNIIKNLNLLSSNEKYELLIVLTDYCQNLINTDPYYLKELHEIHKLMIQENIVLDTNYEFMHISLFRTIIAAALRNDDCTWAENFINKYSQKLEPHLRENAHHFSSAFVQFKKGNFAEALSSAGKVKLESYFYKRDIKQLTLQCLYELNYHDELITFSDSYKHFLKNNPSLKSEDRERIFNFINYASALMNIKNKTGNLNIQQLMDEIEKNNCVTSKQWLMEKVSELSVN
jgi:hypothetical protein